MKPATAAAAVPQELTLDDTVVGVMESPIRVMLYGEPKLGKTTFAAKAPSPYFIDVEQSTRKLDIPVARYFPESWPSIIDRVERLTVAKHDYRTVVIDTLDAAEQLLWEHICEKAGKTSIEEVGGGFGKGYTEAVAHWRTLLYALERMQEKRNLNVVLLAHSTIKAFHDPMGTSYDRYLPRMNEKAAGQIAQWCDDILFARLHTVVREDKRTKRAKGTSSEVRVVYTRPSASWYAGCRGNLPEELPLEWADYESALRSATPADPDELIAAIGENAKRLPADLQKQSAEALARCGKDAIKLAQLDNWVRAKLPPPEATASE